MRPTETLTIRIARLSALLADEESALARCSRLQPSRARDRAYLKLKADVAFRRFMLSYARYWAAIEAKNPNFRQDQPRWPKDTPGSVGGRWSGGSGMAPGPAGRSKDDPEPETVGDGHHITQRSLFERLPFSDNTRRIFETDVTGPLRPGSHQFDHAHRRYNTAVERMMNDYLRELRIRPEQMTPEQAREFGARVRGSGVPEIRDYLRHLERNRLPQSPPRGRR